MQPEWTQTSKKPKIRYHYFFFLIVHLFEDWVCEAGDPSCAMGLEFVQMKLQQNQMLEGKELDKLFEILNSKEISLQEIEANFLVNFNESLSVFKASYALNNLLNHNLLTHQQRIIALFLLIQNFKSEGIKKHPFGATILSISQNTTEAFERRMIADLIIECKREKYSKTKIEELFDDEQVIIEMSEERPEIKKLRDEFISLLPKISQVKRSEVFNVVPDFNQKDKKNYPPEEEVNRSSIKQAEMSCTGFSLGFMRPIPTFIEVSPFEMNWLSPGIVTDVHWDNTADIEKKLTKCKGHIKKGLESHLSKEESTEIDRCLENEAYAVLNLDLTPDNLILLINNNPYVAVSFLVKLGNYPIIGDYLESILDSNISLNSIDVVARLIKASKVPMAFVEAFVLKNLKESQSIPENHKERGKMARIISNFLKSMVKNKMIDLSQYAEDVHEFANYFKEVDQAQSLRRLTSPNQE